MAQHPAPQHTPGPWHHHKPDESICDAKGSPLCDLFEPRRGSLETNARLIAAAPEMLALIQAILDAPVYHPKTISEARALLAKIEGKEN